MYRDDIGMVQFGRCLCLPGESGADIGAVGKMSRKKFWGYSSIEFGVFSQIHFTHATGSDLIDNPIMVDSRAHSERCLRSGSVVITVLGKLSQKLPSRSTTGN
jgi:hypothetical protein